MSGYFVTGDPYWTLNGATLLPSDPAWWLVFDCAGILFDCPTIQSPGNPTWDFGSGTATMPGAFEQGAPGASNYATAGDMRVGPAWTLQGSIGGPANRSILDWQGGLYVGDLNCWTYLRGGDASGVALSTGAGIYLQALNGNLEVHKGPLRWESDAAAPTLSQLSADLGHGTTAQPLLVTAQSNTHADAGTGGATGVRAGDGFDVGGAAWMRPGHGATHGVCSMKDADGVNRIVVNADTGVTIQGLYTDIGSAWGPTALRVSSGGPIQLFVGQCAWGGAVPNPSLSHESADLGHGIAAQVLSVTAQSNTHADTPLDGYVQLGLSSLKSHTVAELNDAQRANVKAHAGSVAFCSNESGGATMVYSNGTNWLRVYDNAIMS